MKNYPWIYEYEAYLVLSQTWYQAQFKTSRLDYNEQLKHNSAGYVHIIGSICNVYCGNLHKLLLFRLQRWSSVTLGCIQAPNGIGLLVPNEENHQLKSPNFVENRPIFTIEISYPNNFFFTKTFCRLQSHFKNISWLTNTTPLEMIRQTLQRTPLVFPRGVCRGCRNEDSNS